MENGFYEYMLEKVEKLDPIINWEPATLAEATEIACEHVERHGCGVSATLGFIEREYDGYPRDTREYIRLALAELDESDDTYESDRLSYSHAYATINEAKSLAEQCGALIEKLEGLPGIDQRAVALGKTNLQQGFMWTVRGIARPTTF